MRDPRRTGHFGPVRTCPIQPPPHLWAMGFFVLLYTGKGISNSHRQGQGQNCSIAGGNLSTLGGMTRYKVPPCEEPLPSCLLFVWFLCPSFTISFSALFHGPFPARTFSFCFLPRLNQHPGLPLLLLPGHRQLWTVSDHMLPLCVSREVPAWDKRSSSDLKNRLPCGVLPMS